MLRCLLVVLFLLSCSDVEVVGFVVQLYFVANYAFLLTACCCCCCLRVCRKRTMFRNRFEMPEIAERRQQQIVKIALRFYTLNFIVVFIDSNAQYCCCCCCYYCGLCSCVCCLSTTLDAVLLLFQKTSPLLVT